MSLMLPYICSRRYKVHKTTQERAEDKTRFIHLHQTAEFKFDRDGSGNFN